MPDRSTRLIVIPRALPGSGILRPFPSPELPHIDPFVFLDTAEPLHLGSREIFVGPHPHRGFQPVSLLFKGRTEHRDSLGNRTAICSGGMQWLFAGSGALHEEVLKGDEEGVFHMAQLWINLPAELKMKPPDHRTVDAVQVPEIGTLGTNCTVRLYAGSLAGEQGPAPIPTPVLVAHIVFEPDAAISIPIPRGWNAALCVVAGTPQLADGTLLQAGHTPVFRDDGESISVASHEHAEILLMCGRPIGEPIVAGGSFVMTTREEIEQAIDDYQSGKMGRLTSSR